MSKKNAAKLIRVLTVPPVMVSVMLLILYLGKRELFGELPEVMVMVVLLGILPVLAYPAQKIIPGFRKDGREGQRKLAFIMNLIGYAAAFVWAIASKVNSGIMLICSTYFLSVIMLAVCNLLHFKASGHACSVTGPFVILLYFMGKRFVVPVLIIASAIVWSSLALKRHTFPQLISGSIVCIVAFVISIGISGVIRG